ncbi:MAG TPA: IS110 family transposase [Thermodesulfobacteriota bacterium]|nr:IS110 family transposase [Thermodesulfobacteriota bacterium]
MDGVNNIRLEKFRQIKQEIRGSKEYLIVGIDVAKENHHAFFGTATGKTLLRRLVFENNREGFERLFFQAEAVKAQHCLKTVVFGLEPTANYHKPLGEHLIKNKHQVVLVSGNAVKNNRELLDGRWDKHDVKDSANVADLISQGKCLFYDYPEEGLRELRSLISLKRRLKKYEHGCKARIRNHLIAQYFPELDRFAGYGEGLAIVRWCLSPQAIRQLGCGEFMRMVGSRNGGCKQRRRLQVIWDKAGESIGCTGTEALAFEAQVMAEQLKQTQEAIRATDEKIKQRCIKFSEYTHLLSIPGFGPDVSAKVLAAIGNPFRFESATQVLKLAGLDLSAQRSGKGSGRAIPVLSKKGKADLRYALYQAALIASNRNRTFITYFTNKLRGRAREKGIKTKMRVKLSAKLLIIAWTIMKKKEQFNPEYLNLN